MWKFFVPTSASGWHSMLEAAHCLLKSNRSSDPVGKKRLLGEVTPWNFTVHTPWLSMNLLLSEGASWRDEGLEDEWTLGTLSKRVKSSFLGRKEVPQIWCLTWLSWPNMYAWAANLGKLHFLWLHLQEVPITVPRELPCWKCRLAGPAGIPHYHL